MIRLLTLLFICVATGCLAQEIPSDSLKNDTKSDPRGQLIIDKSKDTLLIKSYAARYNPRKALHFAAVFPGAGQIYTKKYWKLPLVWGGLGATAYSINFYENLYTKYKSYLFDTLNGKTTPYSEDVLRTAINKVRRQRDFMIIIMGLVYVLQMVDAHVDAHLKEFDLNPDLHVKLQPMFENDQQLGRQTGFSLNIRF